jgi:uncharacterized membrane protein
VSEPEGDAPPLPESTPNDPPEVLPPEVLTPESAEAQAYLAWSYSGPIPLPRVAEGWEVVLPGAADRILSMAEREQQHRHRMDERSLGLFGRGQLLGFLLGMTAVIAGAVLIALDKQAYGLATILSSLGVLVGVFVYSRLSSNGGEHEQPRERPAGEPPPGDDR